ncbi:(2Fe-2S)-binding protein [Paenibacillus guangzhouensis]|uniref:(2Fe-2S)-binding protein n=1 Tax=Paenibacillus guangzhouensis TaxID=1473112 RepID=UPI00187B36FE|nr:(2Fe-2S)-binding protein [Paenibacillus guangzhouensis]
MLIPTEILDKYMITHQDQSPVIATFELSRLADREGALAFLNAYAPELKAHSLDVAATYFTAQFARMFAAFHYAIWRCGVHLDLSMNILRVRIARHPDGYVTLKFDLKAIQGTTVPLANRSLLVKSLMTSFYSEQVRPILQSLASAAGISVGALWGIIPTYFEYYYEQWLEDPIDEVQRIHLAEDMDVLRHQLPPAVFGRVRNPFLVKFRYMDSPYEAGKKIKLKSACCLAYKTEESSYCLTCPRLSEAERSRRVAEYQARQS